MADKHIENQFNGFPKEAFEFFEQLALHNNRDWFSRPSGSIRAGLPRSDEAVSC